MSGSQFWQWEWVSHRGGGKGRSHMYKHCLGRGHLIFLLRYKSQLEYDPRETAWDALEEHCVSGEKKYERKKKRHTTFLESWGVLWELSSCSKKWKQRSRHHTAPSLPAHSHLRSWKWPRGALCRSVSHPLCQRSHVRELRAAGPADKHPFALHTKHIPGRDLPTAAHAQHSLHAASQPCSLPLYPSPTKTSTALFIKSSLCGKAFCWLASQQLDRDTQYSPIQPTSGKILLTQWPLDS